MNLLQDKRNKISTAYPIEQTYKYEPKIKRKNVNPNLQTSSIQILEFTIQLFVTVCCSWHYNNAKTKVMKLFFDVSNSNNHVDAVYLLLIMVFLNNNINN